MDLIALENFLFVPEAGTPGGFLYELKGQPGFANNCFVLVPYGGTRAGGSAPHFYKIIKKEYIADLSVFKKNLPLIPVKFKALLTKRDYLEHVKRLKLEIQRGNIYEINYCIKFQAANTAIDPVAVFLELNAIAKAPYACLLKTGDTFIICASPELFLKREGRSIFTKPIKGTVKRGSSKEEDLALKDKLYHNIKERTENVMAVDVARNDLSKFAAKGTVKVDQLYNIETFETVHQMVSTVRCEIKNTLLQENDEQVFKEIIDATFPMASMTGAPKLRAIQLIAERENFEREFYSGAMGFIGDGGDFSLAVIIRSIFYNSKTKYLSLAVGGAITNMSEPEQEYNECLLKADALFKALHASVENV